LSGTFQGDSAWWWRDADLKPVKLLGTVVVFESISDPGQAAGQRASRSLETNVKPVPASRLFNGATIGIPSMPTNDHRDAALRTRVSLNVLEGDKAAMIGWLRLGPDGAYSRLVVVGARTTI
jgi:hypothetical protein